MGLPEMDQTQLLPPGSSQFGKRWEREHLPAVSPETCGDGRAGAAGGAGGRGTGDRGTGKAGFLVEEPSELSFTGALGTGQGGGSRAVKGVPDGEGSLDGRPMGGRPPGAAAQAGPHSARCLGGAAWALPVC